MKAQSFTDQDSLPTTRTLLIGLWCHISRRRRIQLGLIFVVMLASGAAELASLGAVLPFLALLSDPDHLWQQPLIQSIALSLFNPSEPALLPVSLHFRQRYYLQRWPTRQSLA